MSPVRRPVLRSRMDGGAFLFNLAGKEPEENRTTGCSFGRQEGLWPRFLPGSQYPNPLNQANIGLGIGDRVPSK
jgi:hypothetical protein